MCKNKINKIAKNRILKSKKVHATHKFEAVERYNGFSPNSPKPPL